jgi:hypothetical protein
MFETFYGFAVKSRYQICKLAWGQGEWGEGVETAIHRASPSVMRASRGVRRSNCKQIWLRVHDPSEGMLKLLLYKILLV